MSSNAVLTTHNQTFQLRQVQSSNSIFLLQSDLPSVFDTNGLIAVPNLSVIAQCKATLELIPSPTSSVAWLQQLLPFYNGAHEETSVASSSASQATLAERKSKRDYLTDLPLSEDQFEGGWREIRAFESDGQAFKPSVRCLVGVWKAVVSASTAHGINLGRHFKITDVLDMLEADDYPRSLVETVLWNLMTTESVNVGSMCVDQGKCIRWVGATMLEAMGKQSAPISDFQEAWKNELPEQWRTAANLEVLKVSSDLVVRLEDTESLDKGIYCKPTSTTIQFSSDTSDSTLQKESLAGATSGSGKNARKWHEKFKATR